MAAPAPVLSKKQQGKSTANRKKPMKAIKNVFTTTEAEFWPKLSEESERNQLLIELQRMRIVDRNRRLKSAAGKSKPGIKSRKINWKCIKFGINEIARRVADEDCKGILLDADVPRILVLHLTTASALKRIPMLCIDNLNLALQKIFRIRSSSICFTDSLDVENICIMIKQICTEKFATVYKDDSSELSENPPKSGNDDVDLAAASTASSSRRGDGAASVNTNTLDSDTKGVKRKLPYQPLLVKKVKGNPERKQKKVV